MSKLIRKIVADAVNYNKSEDYQRVDYVDNQFKTVSGDPYKIFVPENLKKVYCI